MRQAHQLYDQGKFKAAATVIEDASTHLEILMKPILDTETAEREARVLAQLAKSAATTNLAVGA